MFALLTSQQPVETTVTVLSLLVLLFVLYVIKDQFEGRGMPPGPWRFPIIGNLPRSPGDIYNNYLRFNKEYGDIFRVKYGVMTHVILNDINVIKEAFSKLEFTSKLYQFPFDVITWENHGIVQAIGKRWYDHRTFALRHFKDLGMGKSDKMQSIICTEIESLVSVLKGKADTGKPVKIDYTVNITILNIVWKLLTGGTFDYNDHELISKMLQWKGLFGKFNLLFMIMFFPYTPKFVYQKKLDELNELMAKVEDICASAIRERRKEYDPSSPSTYVDYYLREMDAQKDLEDSTFTERQLSVTLFDIMLAGSETTGGTVKWGILYLAAFPEIQAKIQKELDEVVGRDRLPSLLDKPRLPYTEAACSDLQRLANVLPLGLEHVAIEDATLRGFRIPKGTVIYANLHKLHRDPLVWEKPDEFYPNHFLDENGKYRATKGFIPFSTGKRQCAGDVLARAELFLYFSYLIHHFNFILPPGVKPDFEPDRSAGIMFALPVDYEVIIETRA